MKFIKKLAANFIPSPIKIDFEKGGVSTVHEVAPYPDGLIDTKVPILTASSGWEYEPSDPI